MGHALSGAAVHAGTTDNCDTCDDPSAQSQTQASARRWRAMTDPLQ